jgi:DNA polymerase III alpha subunit
MPASFVHLRLHTEYSLVDGLVRIKPLIKTLAGMNMPAVAVTDQNNMCSLVKFYKAAMGGGIKPISGADLWLSNKDPENPPQPYQPAGDEPFGLSQPHRADFPWLHRWPAQWPGDH